MAKWKPGDVVRLKSGGPDMTVDGYVGTMSGETSSRVNCHWFSSNHKQEKGVFHEDALEKGGEGPHFA